MSEEVIHVNDLLMSMAGSLIERQPIAVSYNRHFEDSVKQFRIGGKPPREIFYRKTVTFATKLPPPIPPRICTCMFLCGGVNLAANPAVVKCLSCSIFDPTGAAYFCKPCFDSRHPWYRAPHTVINIAQDENVSYTLQVAHRIAEVNRYEREGKDILQQMVQTEYPKLAYVADDEKIDGDIRIAGRRIMAMEERMMELRRKLQRDINEDARENYLAIEGGESRTAPTLGASTPLLASMQIPYNDNSMGSSPVRTTGDDSRGAMIKRQENLPLLQSRSEPATMFSRGVYSVGNEPSPTQAGFVDASSSPTRSPLAAMVKSLGEIRVTEEGGEEGEDRNGVATDLYLSSSSSHSSDNGFAVFHPSMEAENSSVDRNSAPGLSSSGDAFVGVNKPVTRNTDEAGLRVDPAAERGNSRNSDTTTQATDLQSSSSKVIQRVFRGHLGRRILSLAIVERTLRVWSEEAGRDYYYDRIKGESSWLPPKFLLSKHLDMLQYHTEEYEQQSLIWYCKRNCPRRLVGTAAATPTDKKRCVECLQGFARCILARKRVIKIGDMRYRRVWDKETSSYYYADVWLGVSAWLKNPVCYMNAGAEPPLLTPDEYALDGDQLQQQQQHHQGEHGHWKEYEEEKEHEYSQQSGRAYQPSSRSQVSSNAAERVDCEGEVSCAAVNEASSSGEREGGPTIWRSSSGGSGSSRCSPQSKGGNREGKGKGKGNGNGIAGRERISPRKNRIPSVVVR